MEVASPSAASGRPLQSPSETRENHPVSFFAGGGEMGALISAFDWSMTPLGPLASWPQSLKTTVGMMVAAPNPMVLLWGFQGTLIYNDGYARFAGRRHPDLLGVGAREGWPEIADFNDNVIRTVLRGESMSLKAQELVLDRAGAPEPAWLDLDYAPVPDETGAPAGVLVFVTEITDRILAERRTAEEVSRQRRMLQQMPGFAAVLSGPEHRFDYVNDAYIAISGDRSLVGHTVREVFPELVDQGFFELLDGVYTKGERFVARALPISLAQQDGQRFIDLLYEPIRDEDGAVSGIFVGGYDVTEANRTASALEESEVRYRTVFDAATTGLCIIQLKFDADMTPVDYMIVDGNSAFSKLTGLENANGKWVSEIAPGLERHWFELYGRVALTGEPARFEQPADVFGRWYDVQAIRLGDPAYHRVAILFDDITARRNAGIRQKALIDLNDSLRDLRDIREIAFAASRILNTAIGGNRAVFASVADDQETIITDRDFTADGVASLEGELNLRDFGTFIDDLRAGQPVVIPNVAEDPRTRDFAAAHRARHVSAFVIAPVIEQDRLVAIMSVSSATPRAWTLDEVEFLQEVAARTRITTERVRSAAAVRESETRYEALFNAMDEGFCIIEFIDGPEGPLSDYVHVEANAAYAKNAGIPDVVGQKVREMVGPEAQGWIDLYKGVLDTGNSIRFEKELEATGRWLELSAFRIEPVSRKQVAVLFNDLTARKQAERALLELNTNLEQRVAEALAERKLLADIIQSADAFVQVADTDLRWLAINEASAKEFERIYGVRPQAGDRMPDALAHMPEHAVEVEGIWRRAIAEAPFVEIAQFGSDGRDRRFYEMRFYPLLDEASQRIGAYQIVYDVTDRLNEQARLREIEEALRQSQKMEAVGQLTGGIAHDFNNLLGGISGSLELLEKRIAAGRLDGVQRYITSAQEASRRAASLTQRLLAFSRRQTLDPKPLDANKLVSGMEDLVRRTVGPTIDVEFVGAGGLWPTKVDASQLENALLNLCINARDAMAPKGGKLTIETANKWLDERAARDRELPPGQYISICVTDNGAGMAPDVIARAFDPFFTTKPIGQGTGLGLSMVYGFVRQSNGQVRIYSEVGIGTTMCLYLPRHVGNIEDADLPKPDETVEPGAGETVLVIDDEAILRMLVVDVLEENGYNALEAQDGPSGLRILQSDVRIDLLITDVGLPGGMNGRQVADAARQLRPNLKILFITGYAENAIINHGHLEPGMEVLTKPFPVATLGQRIRDMIER